MKGIEKSVFGSFFRICEYDSTAFCWLNEIRPYLKVNNERMYVDIIKIIPIGTTKTGNPIFCYELLWR